MEILLANVLKTKVEIIEKIKETNISYGAYRLPEIENEGLLTLFIYNRSKFQFYYDTTPIPIPNIHTKKQASNMMQHLDLSLLSINNLNPEILTWIKEWINNTLEFDTILEKMK
jgi:hypothetical protein